MKINLPLWRLLANLVPVLVLTMVAVISHWEWFNPYSTLTSGDWYYWHDEPTAELINTWGPWLTFWGIGNSNPQIPFLSFKSIWSLIIQLGGSFDLAAKITFFWPIAIFGFLSPYWFALKANCNRWESVSLGLFYGSTSYFLVKQTGHLPIALIYALAPLIFLFALQAIYRFKPLQLLVIIFLVCLASYIEIRCTLLLLLILALIMPFQVNKNSRFWLQLAIFAIFFLLANLYWVLPVLLGGVSKIISSITSRPLFGSNLFSIINALLLHDSSWTGHFPNQDFVNQTPKIEEFIPVFTVLLICLYSIKPSVKNFYKKKNLFISFILIWLLGIFLTKQVSPPFGKSYLWAYENLPAFNLYREAGKFYMITAIGILGSISYGLRWTSKKVSLAVTILLTIFSLINIKPAITKDLGTLFVQRSIPNDYLILKDFLKNDESNFRVLWVPTYSRWSYFNKERGSMGFVHQIETDWKELTNLSSHGDFKFALKESINEGLQEKLLNSSVKYIVIPLADFTNDEDIYRFYHGTPEQWSKILDKTTYLERLSKGYFGKIAVYQFKYWQQKALISDQDGRKIPTKIENPISGVFKIKLPPYSQLETLTSLKISERNDNWTSCFHNNLYNLLFYGCASKNQLFIDPTCPDNIKVYFMDALYKKSKAEELYIIQKSVRWFWIGLLISSISVILMILSILILLIHEYRYKHRNYAIEILNY